jgi:hypothetical protein
LGCLPNAGARSDTAGGRRLAGDRTGCARERGRSKGAASARSRRLKSIRIQASVITDEASLHAEFQKELGFPGYYGNNWNAWIDCMSCLTEAAGYMSSVHLDPGEDLVLELADGEAFRIRCPNVFADLVDCVESVNSGYADRGEDNRITVSLTGSPPRRSTP